jgi:hypothetical protein
MIASSFVLLWLALGAAPDAGLSLETEQARVTALKTAARALVKCEGCQQTAQCKVLPMGSRPCGGPSEFLVYCARSTAEKKLKQAARAATDAEKALNAKSETMSTCSVLSPPVVQLSGGACKAAAPKTSDLPM